jgi:hypothetical protein
MDHYPHVTARQSRSKNGIASLAYVLAIHVLPSCQDVDARHKAGHDDVAATYLMNWLV